MVVLALAADVLFGLCGSERADELFIPLLSPSLISLLVSVDVKPHVYWLTDAVCLWTLSPVYWLTDAVCLWTLSPMFTGLLTLCVCGR